MGRVRENFNLIVADIKENCKNFLSIFGDDKIDEEDLDIMDSALAIELRNSLNDIESGKCLEIDTPKTSSISRVTKTNSRTRIGKIHSDSIDTEIEKVSNIQIIKSENYDERG